MLCVGRLNVDSSNAQEKQVKMKSGTAILTIYYPDSGSSGWFMTLHLVNDLFFSRTMRHTEHMNAMYMCPLFSEEGKRQMAVEQ
jgi:hypothetical protein